ncbi:MAG: ice-binding family protein, partial [Anaerolineae bacterium]
TSISLQTGASLNGRALAQTGEVTLDSNTIFGPICAAKLTPTPTATPTATPTTTLTTTPTPTDTPQPRPTRTPRPQPTETPTAAPPTETPTAAPTPPFPSILPVTGVGPALDSRQPLAAAAGLGFLGLGLVLFGFALRRKRGT